MANPKKGQLMQFMFPLRDTSGSVLSGVTESDFNSGATRKFFGVNHGVSDAFTSGTISKTGRLVKSGVFQMTLKGTENNFDEMMVRITKTGAKENIITWENGDYDDSDLASLIVAGHSLASDAHSAAAQANSRVLLNQSRISDVQSYLVAMSAVQSDIYSAAVALSGMESDIYSLLSDVQSDFQSRVPKRVATDSQLSDLHSDLRSYLVGVSAVASDAHSAAAQANSRALVNQSRVSDLDSYVRQDLVVGIDNGFQLVLGDTGNIYSLLSDVDSNFQSRVPKETAGRSQLSDLHSDLRSYLVGVSAIASDAHSAAAAAASRTLLVQSSVSDIYSLASDVQSDFQSRVPKRVATDSQLSDLHSDLRSVVLGLSAITSDAHSAAAAGASRALVLQSSVSDVQSAVAVVAATNAKVDTMLEQDGAVYRLTTNALEQAPGGGGSIEITNAFSITAAQAAAQLTGGTMIITRGCTFRQQFTGLGSLANRSNLAFCVKAGDTDTDATALALVTENEGLVTLNGADAEDSTQASITVDDEDAGDVTVEITHPATTELPLKRGRTPDLAVAGFLVYRTNDDADPLVSAYTAFIVPNVPNAIP